MMFGLKEKTTNEILSVFRKFKEIDEVVLYGSRAKGNYKNGSDIDLTFIGEKLNLSLIGQIELDLNDLLLPYTFDMSIKKQISNPDLIDHINRIGIIFYKKENII